MQKESAACGALQLMHGDYSNALDAVNDTL
jgi:hypothetical protein